MFLCKRLLDRLTGILLALIVVVFFSGTAAVADGAERLWLVVDDASCEDTITITRNRDSERFSVRGVTGVDAAVEYKLAEYGIRLLGLSGDKEIIITDNADAAASEVLPVYLALSGVNLSHTTEVTTPIAVRGYSAAILDVEADSTVATKIGSAAIEVNTGNAVTITSASAKSLKVTGPSAAGNGGGAGAAIGGSDGGDAGSIHITGNVHITAGMSSSNSAGNSNGAVIGGAGLTANPPKAGSGGTILIDGDAEVTAVSRSYGAAIGGGWAKLSDSVYTGGDGGSITIGGNARVMARSEVNYGVAAAIGGAASGNGGSIVIEGNAIVDARTTDTTRGAKAAAIGSGGLNTNSEAIANRNGGDITIRGNATVIAMHEDNIKDYGGAGIGGGMGSGAGNIRIEGGVVYAQGGANNPGIGPGRRNKVPSSTAIPGGMITISGGTVIAKSGVASWSGTNRPVAIGRSSDITAATIISGGNVYPVPNAMGMIHPAPTNDVGAPVYLVKVKVTEPVGGAPAGGVAVTAGNYRAFTGFNAEAAPFFEYNEVMNGWAYLWLPAGKSVIEAGGDFTEITVAENNENTVQLTGSAGKTQITLQSEDDGFAVDYEVYTGAADKDVMCILAAYNSEHRLVDTQIHVAAVRLSGGIYTANVQLSDKAEGAAYVKAFLWDANRLMPLCEMKQSKK